MNTTTCFKENFTTYLNLPAHEIRPMTEDESMLFMSLVMNKEPIEPPVGFFLYDIIKKRIDVYEVADKIDIKVVILCSFFSTTPANIVTWFHTLLAMAEQKSPVTIEDWTDKFPMGIPTKEAISRIWQEQKILNEKGVLV